MWKLIKISKFGKTGRDRDRQVMGQEKKTTPKAFATRAKK